ncbi:MAG: putative Ig domain-containing protein [Gammaproteobacteria bacterium]
MYGGMRRYLIAGIAALLQGGCFGGGSSESSNDPPANRAPTISVPTSFDVMVGQSLTITPTASDPDGDTLTFSVANKPNWLSFSSTTGVLTGTPQSGDVGSVDVTITVSDGRGAQANDQTRVNVQQAVAGRATLSWEAPTQRTDGSPLTNLAGFKLYYGTNAGNLSNVKQVPDAGARSDVIDNLTVGTWYFAASAYDTAGLESARSNVASKTIT